MPADKGDRLDDRQRIANFREQPIETNEYHSVDDAEGEFLWSSSPQNVDLLPQRPNLCLKHYRRPDQIDNHPTNEPAMIPHCARSSSDSRSTAKQDKVCDRDRMGMLIVETNARIRREHFIKGKTIKEIARDLKVSRNTVRKVLRSGETSFEYERVVQPRPKLGRWAADLDGLLAANAAKSAREQLTLIRIFEELRGRGYDGGYDAVRRYARAWA